MRIFFRRILIFVLVAALFFTNINISVAASGIGKESFYQMKNEQEDTRQIENITTESQESTTAISKETTEEKEKSEHEPRSSIMKQKKRVQSRNRKVQEHRINLSNNRRN